MVVSGFSESLRAGGAQYVVLSFLIRDSQWPKMLQLLAAAANNIFIKGLDVKREASGKNPAVSLYVDGVKL